MPGGVWRCYGGTTVLAHEFEDTDAFHQVAKLYLPPSSQVVGLLNKIIFAHQLFTTFLCLTSSIFLHAQLLFHAQVPTGSLGRNGPGRQLATKGKSIGQHMMRMISRRLQANSAR
jgi:hypothetical protein